MTLRRIVTVGITSGFLLSLHSVATAEDLFTSENIIAASQGTMDRLSSNEISEDLAMCAGLYLGQGRYYESKGDKNTAWKAFQDIGPFEFVAKMVWAHHNTDPDHIAGIRSLVGNVIANGLKTDPTGAALLEDRCNAQLPVVVKIREDDFTAKGLKSLADQFAKNRETPWE